jgi:hypothetical protein
MLDLGHEAEVRFLNRVPDGIENSILKQLIDFRPLGHQARPD